ncbi:peptidoglycan hydrolase CwlO-like protein [Neobacillus niacini]|uniref:3D domain-containing protein n=1 Tax=Neobacillus driksii TaxID=3035913 RepID=UPI0027874C9E|nr:3D domain-containing protein [Neobacillus niacini]MDQ0974539.1 peptidoglycan hydrolase CwlO-like protein [Neobacillus niacini]
MQLVRRMIFVVLTCVIMVSGTVVVHAESSKEALHNVEQELEQKANEKNSINQEIEKLNKEMEELQTYITQNREALAETQKRIDETRQLIEQKKEEIVFLEDKIHNRKDVMKSRLVALQEDEKLNVAINVILESKSVADLIQRASAVTTLFNADNDIIKDQENDLKKIEENVKVIAEQEEQLAVEQENLAKHQAELDLNLQKRQESLTVMQQKYSQANEEMAGIQAQVQAAQEKVRQEQAAARAIAAANAPAPAATPAPAGTKGTEMYVTATAYSWQSAGNITYMGHNIKENPNIKLIAVDPSVIPLGSKVWVEGYGVAIAGDTGGAIKGHKIDVVMPDNAHAIAWGRKTVKVVILN